MKKSILFFFALVCLDSVASPPPEVCVSNPSQIAKIDGIIIDQKTKEAFTGIWRHDYYYANRRTGEPSGDILYTHEAHYVGGVLKCTKFMMGRFNPPDGCRAAFYSQEYKKGRLHGLSQGFDASSNLIWQVEFSNHMPIEYAKFPDYATNRDILARNGLLYHKKAPETPFSGFIVEFRPNGQLAHKWTYKNGKRDGAQIRFSRDGSIDSLREYRDGTRHGLDYRLQYNTRIQSIYIDEDQEWSHRHIVDPKIDMSGY